MRKNILTPTENTTSLEQPWLDIEQIARVEMTSEAQNFPIENVFNASSSEGWRAETPGTQTLQLIFDGPLSLKHIRLAFVETQHARTQEYWLGWSDDGQTFHEIVRQQWNFNPQGSTQSVEDFAVNLSQVTSLKLTIIPNIRDTESIASLSQWQIA